METIKSIEEIIFPSGNSWSSMEGYKITTSSDKEIKILIDNNQSCCESWGYLSSEDDFDEFIGVSILDIKLVDSALNVVEKKLQEEWIEQDDCIFVNVETDKGTLQFVVYNSHNGYYSHHVKISWDGFEEDNYL